MQVSNLKYLKKITDLPLIQLLGGWPDYVTPDTGATHAEMVSDAGLDAMAAYAAGVGAWKDTLLPPQASGYIGASTSLVQRAQSRGMQARLCTPEKPSRLVSRHKSVLALRPHALLLERSKQAVFNEHIYLTVAREFASFTIAPQKVVVP
jgi:glycerophosphoryl diester phosphodiesterase